MRAREGCPTSFSTLLPRQSMRVVFDFGKSSTSYFTTMFPFYKSKSVISLFCQVYWNRLCVLIANRKRLFFTFDVVCTTQVQKREICLNGPAVPLGWNLEIEIIWFGNIFGCTERVFFQKMSINWKRGVQHLFSAMLCVVDELAFNTSFAQRWHLAILVALSLLSFFCLATKRIHLLAGVSSIGFACAVVTSWSFLDALQGAGHHKKIALGFSMIAFPPLLPTGMASGTACLVLGFFSTAAASMCGQRRRVFGTQRRRRRGVVSTNFSGREQS